MALTTYAGLSTGVYARLNRTAISADFDVFLSLAEAEIKRRLALSPVRPMHTVATATVSTAYLAAPIDILDVDSLSVADGGDVFELKPTNPQSMTAMYQRDDTTDRPEYYAQVGTEFRFWPQPDTSYTLTLIYWAHLPALTSSATTNWLSLAHPDVYYHGVLAHAYQEYFDQENADIQAGLFDLALQKVLDAYPSRPDRTGLRSEISPNQLSNWPFLLT